MEKQQLCTEGFCVTEIHMAPGAIRKASGGTASYALIPVNDCELSIDDHGLASVHAYRSGAIQYLESASHSWKNSMMVCERSSSVRANSRRVPISLPSGMVRNPSEPTS